MHGLAERRVLHHPRLVLEPPAFRDGGQYLGPNPLVLPVATRRQHDNNVSDYLTSRFEASPRGQVIPSLLPVITTKIEVV